MYLNQKKVFSLNLQGKLYTIEKPLVMGILNLTPDSFYDGGKNNTHILAIEKLEKMLVDGADIIDIGAMSSKPYSQDLEEHIELGRLKLILPELIKKCPQTIFSIDTYRSGIAEFAIDNGVSIINDITGGRKDESILQIAKKYHAPYIAMHMQGSPQNMQNQPNYEHIISEIMYFFSERLNRYREIGLSDIILDVGFGFGKTIEDNFKLLKNLSIFSEFDCPILVGISRKSMIFKTLEIAPGEALNGTTALHFEALRQGANILRVHDVKEAVETVRLFQMYQSVKDN